MQKKKHVVDSLEAPGGREWLSDKIQHMDDRFEEVMRELRNLLVETKGIQKDLKYYLKDFEALKKDYSEFKRDVSQKLGSLNNFKLIMTAYVTVVLFLLEYFKDKII